MEVWDELNPYWVDYVYPKDEKTGIGKNAQTVKEIKEQRTLEARIKNGLDVNINEVNHKKEIERNTKISTTCKLT